MGPLGFPLSPIATGRQRRWTTPSSDGRADVALLIDVDERRVRAWWRHAYGKSCGRRVHSLTPFDDHRRGAAPRRGTSSETKHLPVALTFDRHNAAQQRSCWCSLI